MLNCKGVTAKTKGQMIVLDKTIITFILLLLIISCTSIIKVPDVYSTLLKNNTKIFEYQTVYSRYYSVDDIRVSSYKFDNKDSNEDMFKVPYGNRNITVTIGAETIPIYDYYDTYSRQQVYFDFNVTLAPKNVYTIQSEVNFNKVTAWITDSTGNRISKKLSKELVYNSMNFSPGIFDNYYPYYQNINFTIPVMTPVVEPITVWPSPTP